MKKITTHKGNKLKYYNIITDIQKKPYAEGKKLKENFDGMGWAPQKLCWDFWNSEIVRSNAEHSEKSNIEISKFGRTNTGSIISEEESSKNGRKIGKSLPRGASKGKGNKFHYSRYTKTDATRTDTKSNKKTYSREPSISSNVSGGFSKKRSLPRKYSPSRSSK